MRHHVALLAALSLLCVWACSAEVPERDDAREASSGSGAASNTGSGGASGGSQEAGAGAGAPFANLCEQACAKLDKECGLGDLCAQLPFLTCGEGDSECAAQCVIDADCATVYTLGDPATADAQLMGCLTTCDGDPCQGCVLTSCPDESMACNSDMPCAQYLSCLSGCAPGEVACFDDCATAHDSPATAALVQCAHARCSSECGLDAASTGR
jgi:hypothetical protein